MTGIMYTHTHGSKPYPCGLWQTGMLTQVAGRIIERSELELEYYTAVKMECYTASEETNTSQMQEHRCKSHMWWLVKDARKRTEATWTIHAKLKSLQSDVWQEKPK